MDGSRRAWRRAVEVGQRRWRALPLRTRLLGVVLLLTGLGLAVADAAAAAALRAYLLERVDAQLRAAAPGLARFAGLPERPDDRGTRGRPPTEYYGVLVDPSGRAERTLATPASTAGSPRLPRLDTVATTVRRGEPFSVASSDRGSGWRVLALPAYDGLTGDRVGTVVVASRLSELDRASARLALLELAIGATVLAAVAVAGVALVRRSLRPLVEVESTAAAIAGGDLSRRVPAEDPRTEVGRLSAALNAMLAQVELAFAQRAASESAARASEERMRRFVGDASHELRTPLTSIRGFAELYRHGGVPPGAELDRVMGRVEGEARRMGALVDDLLLLARLDQQRPLELRPVDLRGLLADAGEDLRALSPGRPVELDLAPEPLVVAGDESRLRQVLANLVANAARHTPPTAAVRLSAAAGAGEVVVEVADEGPGLAPEQAARVFERFYRVDTARTRDRGGSGLGLALVSALVDAHGGRVTLDTAPGAGARFRVRLPRLEPQAQARRPGGGGGSDRATERPPTDSSSRPGAPRGRAVPLAAHEEGGGPAHA